MVDRPQQAADVIAGLSGSTPREAREALDEFSVKDQTAALAVNTPAAEPFNGGTITDPLIIQETGDALVVDGTHSKVTVHDEEFDSYVRIHGEPDTSVPYLWLSHADLGTRVAIINLETGCDMRDSAASFGMGFRLRSSANAELFHASVTTGLAFAFAEPDDAVLANGTLALWVDPTAGAMRLKVKGRDAGGTIRTATVNLS